MLKPATILFTMFALAVAAGEAPTLDDSLQGRKLTLASSAQARALPAPKYSESVAAKHNGVVELRIGVNPGGGLVRVLGPQPDADPLLAKAALKALEGARFSGFETQLPVDAEERCLPQRQWATLRYEFVSDPREPRATASIAFDEHALTDPLAEYHRDRSLQALGFAGLAPVAVTATLRVEPRYDAASFEPLLERQVGNPLVHYATVMIAPNGNVVEAYVEDDRVPGDRRASRAVRDALRAWKYPPAADGTTRRVACQTVTLDVGP